MECGYLSPLGPRNETSKANPDWSGSHSRGLVSLSQERIRIDVDAFPISLWIGSHGDREMQVIISGSGVPGVADVSDRLALVHKAAFVQTVGIAIQMTVVVNELLVTTHLVDCRTTGLALKQFENLAAGNRQHRRPFGRRDIDSIVYASITTRCRKCVDQLIRAHSRYGNDQPARLD
jgi:hypothetical protein